LVDKEDIDALLKYCQLAIDLVDDSLKGKEIDYFDDLEELSEYVQKQLVKLFPSTGWRYSKKRFDGHDYNEVKEILRVLGNIYWENTDKLIFTNWW
jgi:hypothetical protein